MYIYVDISLNVCIKLCVYTQIHIHIYDRNLKVNDIGYRKLESET